MKVKEVSQEERTISLKRHQSQCSVCRHPQCQEIEEAWLNWGNTSQIADKYKVTRDAIYRHMNALGLFSERQKRVKFVYEKIIERLDWVSVKDATILAALKAYVALCEREEAKQASAGAPQEVSRPMSDLESEVHAQDGSLPEEGTSDSSEGATGVAAEGNQQAEQGATPVLSKDVQNQESAASNILQ